MPVTESVEAGLPVPADPVAPVPPDAVAATVVGAAVDGVVVVVVVVVGGGWHLSSITRPDPSSNTPG